MINVSIAHNGINRNVTRDFADTDIFKSAQRKFEKTQDESPTSHRTAGRAATTAWKDCDNLVVVEKEESTAHWHPTKRILELMQRRTVFMKKSINGGISWLEPIIIIVLMCH